MKWIARPLLWILTSAVPVFISACYGVVNEIGPYAREKEISLRGRVVDAFSGEGIGGIKVSCLAGDTGEEELDTDTPSDSDAGDSLNDGMIDETYTLHGDGFFEIWHPENSPCESLVVEDVDGEDNGGYYESRELSTDVSDEDIVVELERE